MRVLCLLPYFSSCQFCHKVGAAKGSWRKRTSPLGISFSTHIFTSLKDENTVKSYCSMYTSSHSLSLNNRHINTALIYTYTKKNTRCMMAMVQSRVRYKKFGGVVIRFFFLKLEEKKNLLRPCISTRISYGTKAANEKKITTYICKAFHVKCFFDVEQPYSRW